MQTDLKNRILANVLVDSRPEHVLMPRRRRITAGTILSLAVAATAVTGLVLLMLSKLQAVIR